MNTETVQQLLALFFVGGAAFGYLLHKFTYRLDSKPKSQRPYDWEQDEF
jgi:hypothetical protein